jgi:hypothetical protein
LTIANSTYHLIILKWQVFNCKNNEFFVKYCMSSEVLYPDSTFCGIFLLQVTVSLVEEGVLMSYVEKVVKELIFI